MSTPRRHHLVPQFILRRFAKKERLAMLRREDPQKQPIITSIKNATVHTDFYTIDTADGQRSTEVESYLGIIESEAADAIRNLDVVGGFAADIFFSIDPLHCLVLSMDEYDEKILNADPIQAQYINMNVAFQCYRWIFYRPPINPIAGLELPERGTLVQRMRVGS